MNSDLGGSVDERAVRASDVGESARVEHDVGGEVNFARGPFFDTERIGVLVEPEINTSDATRSMFDSALFSVDVGIAET